MEILIALGILAPLALLGAFDFLIEDEEEEQDTFISLDDYGNGDFISEIDVEGDGVLEVYNSGDDASDFNIEIQFQGEWTREAQQDFIHAADYLSDLILADEPDVTGGAAPIDDIRITARLEPIDGVGGVIGYAGPTAERASNGLPYTARLTMDSADVDTQMARGSWQGFVLHEMLHCLGAGPLWDDMGLTTGSVAGDDLRFTGANATQAYLDNPLSSLDNQAYLGVPIETHGGSGTAGSHWDEHLFGSEILTGYLGNSTYISDITIASLEDLGYDTAWDDITSATDRTGPLPASPVGQTRLMAA